MNSSADLSRSLVPSPDHGTDMEAATTFAFICEAVIIPIIFLLGILTNSISLVVLPKAHIASTFKTCLLALTISDLCAGIAGFIQMMVEVIAFKGHIQWGYYDERAVASFSLYYIFSWFLCTSAGIIIAIVVIRHYTISKPMYAKFNITPHCARITCVSILLITFILYLPTSLNILWQSCYKERTVDVCIWINREIPNLTRITSTYLMMLAMLYGPVLVLVYIGCMIGIRMNLKKTELMLLKLREEAGAVNNDRQKATMKITRTLLMILLLDTICCLPLVAQALSLAIAPKETVFSPTNTAYIVFDSLAEIFLVSRTAYNFWLYAYSHKSFRRRTKALACCLFSEDYREAWLAPVSVTYVSRPTGRIGSNTSDRAHSIDMETEVTMLKRKSLDISLDNKPKTKNSTGDTLVNSPTEDDS